MTDIVVGVDIGGYGQDPSAIAVGAGVVWVACLY